MLAATFLGEVGDIGRFSSRHHFAAHTGTAPLEASSGQVIRHQLSRAGDRKLNHALCMMAMVQIRRPSAGQAYYQRKLAEGKSPEEALRCLKRRLSTPYRGLLADQPLPPSRGDPARPPSRGRCSVCNLPPSRGIWRHAASAVHAGSEQAMSRRCGDSRKMTSTRTVRSSSQPPDAATGTASPWRSRGAETNQSPAPTGKLSALAGSATVTSSPWAAFGSLLEGGGAAGAPSAPDATGNDLSVQSCQRGGLGLATSAGRLRPSSRWSSSCWTASSVLPAPRPGSRNCHSLSRTACMASVPAVVTITASWAGRTTQNWPKAPSPREPWRAIQNWKP